MRKFTTGLATLTMCVAVFSGHGEAQTITTGQLAESCYLAGNVGPAEETAFVRCLGYISGVTDMHVVAATMLGARPIFCLPEEGARTVLLAMDFVQWAYKNPKDAKMPARVGVILSLKEKYPCA